MVKVRSIKKTVSKCLSALIFFSPKKRMPWCLLNILGLFINEIINIFTLLLKLVNELPIYSGLVLSQDQTLGGVCAYVCFLHALGFPPTDTLNYLLALNRHEM